MSDETVETGAVEAVDGGETPSEDASAADGTDAGTPSQDVPAADVAVTETPALTSDFFGPASELLDKGGLAIWAIAALSVLTLAIILWKLWRYSVTGVWRRERAEMAVEKWLANEDASALEIASAGRGVRAGVTAVAIRSALTRDTANAREETVRVAKGQIARARSGLRALELIATIAPLLGLFGTVLGMIAAFQTLQAAGSRADPSALAGGIWEALLTTAAGMAVAIPASAALTWFESTTDRLRLDLEDIATRIFTRPPAQSYAHAAE
ncbi:MAG: MotA/TolQ/ExbB proton channel family protein [Pseudomonadota bacterium]